MKNIMMYHVIADADDEIKLSVMENDKGLYMPSIEFKVEGVDLFWDNPSFLFGGLLDSLKRYKQRHMVPEDLENLEGLKFLNEEYVDTIMEILEKGIELGWDKIK